MWMVGLPIFMPKIKIKSHQMSSQTREKNHLQHNQQISKIVAIFKIGQPKPNKGLNLTNTTLWKTFPKPVLLNYSDRQLNTENLPFIMILTSFLTWKDCSNNIKKIARQIILLYRKKTGHQWNYVNVWNNKTWKTNGDLT
jgi:hypothetical protein